MLCYSADASNKETAAIVTANLIWPQQQAAPILPDNGFGPYDVT